MAYLHQDRKFSALPKESPTSPFYVGPFTSELRALYLFYYSKTEPSPPSFIEELLFGRKVFVKPWIMNSAGSPICLTDSYPGDLGEGTSFGTAGGRSLSYAHETREQN